jgi:hypothetical protein
LGERKRERAKGKHCIRKSGILIKRKMKLKPIPSSLNCAIKIRNK